MQEQYQPKEIEVSAQRFWEEGRFFEVTEDKNKEKYYCLTMFPYPSGRLHMGHTRVYTINDVISRYQRMLGKNVLQPMGWDAFGLPAENAAIKNKVPPAEWTRNNITFMRKQMQKLGLGYDWQREIATCNPSYYRWEQWFFLKLFAKGLVYKKNAEVNWDPVDQTVLANEQVVDGKGWRSGAPVERREIPQWFFKITAYADELLNHLEQLKGWPDQVKLMQKNWIGRSQGAEIFFPLCGTEEHLTIFTTRVDTLFGVTYIAVAPQHPLSKQAAEKDPAIKLFLDECKNIKVAEAELATIEKRGMPTGFKALHPITKQEIPIWVANFVVMEYGTGAVMAVPAHDQRDFEFATKYQIAIKQVILPQDQSQWDFSRGAMTQPGELIDSMQFSGITSKEAVPQMILFLENHGYGRSKTLYRLRDWSVSRQRYWGTPIPIINCPDCGAVPVNESDLPVALPENIQFSGVTSPLKSMPEFCDVSCPACGKDAKRETDTFDTFFESSWYYARFTCPDQDQAMLDERANYWLPVDQYVGGIEHAVLHLLYARFIHKALRDEDLVHCDEPFTRLLTQGMVLNQGSKMSKSVGNVVDPDDLIDRYGADTVRLFIIFAAPPEQNLEWSDSGVEGAHRFLKRVWALCYEQRDTVAHAPKTINLEQADATQRDILRQIHEIVAQAKYDYERLQFNTVVSSCMKLFNLLAKIPAAANEAQDIRSYMTHEGISLLLRLLAPITPHITHSLWQELHFDGLLLNAPWPKEDAAALKADRIELVIQVNGKLRSQMSVAIDANEQTIHETALQDAKVQRAIEGKTVKKIIVVRGKLVNIVVGEA